ASSAHGSSVPVDRCPLIKAGTGEEGMATPPEPVVPPDSLVHAQLAPDRRTAAPGSLARFTIIVDNHDRRSRAVQLQLGGAMSRYSRPRLSTIDRSEEHTSELQSL